VATDALPSQVMSLFPKTIPTGIKYGTITVVKDISVEVTAFRSDGIYRDARRPEDVSFSTSIEEDLQRRDFTVNAIAYDPIAKRFVDPHGGRRDLRHRILRAVGDPKERFSEDALRMLRFFRFLAVLEFRPCRRSLAAIEPRLIRKVSMERIRDEMSKLLLAKAPGSTLLLMHKAGLLREILPEIAQGDGVTQGSFHRFDVLRHSLEAVDNSLPRLELRWAALLHDAAKPRLRSEDEHGIHFYGHDVEGEEAAREILTRLRYSNKLVDKVALLVRWHMFSVHAGSTDKALKRFIRRVGKENVMDLMEVRRADILALGRQTTCSAWENWRTLKDRLQAILDSDATLTISDLAIGGHEVIAALGLKPGPAVGAALEWLLEIVLDDPALNEPQTLLSLLQSYEIPLSGKMDRKTHHHSEHDSRHFPITGKGGRLMRSTAIGLVLMDDERKHVHTVNKETNMRVLNQWADFIRKNFKNVDGSAPEVVTGSDTITSVRVAQKVGEELARANVKQVIMCYNVWNFPFLAWPFLNSLGRDIPVLSLSNNNGQFPGNVGLLATDGALRQAGLRTHRIVGEMDDPATQAKVLNWLRASQAYTTMQNEVYGIYGGHSMGMETGYFHLTPTIKNLGTTGCQIDQLLLVKRMEQEVDEAEVEKGLEWFKELLGPRLLFDGKMLTPETLKNQIRLYLAMRMVNEEMGFDFCGLKGQRELTEYVCLGDVAEMLMNDPYDWNGPKEPIVCATEADSYAAMTMQVLKYISGGLPTLFMDVRLYHPDKDLWDWCNSGNHSSYYAARSMEPKDNFQHITFHPAMEFYFKAGGASVEFNAGPGELTFARLGLWNSDQLYMVIMRGESLDLTEDERKALNAQTDPTWPHVHARIEGTFEEFLNIFPSNHVLGVEGDKVDALIYYCEIAGIKPVVLGERGKERIRPIWELLA
jgi:tRNA nucleotidyltransferase/poly(A) polymerase/L-fucose isomerase-like protein